MTFLSPSAWQSVRVPYQVPSGLEKYGIFPQTLDMHAYVGAAIGDPSDVAFSSLPALGSNGLVDQIDWGMRLRQKGYGVIIPESPGVGFSSGLTDSRGRPLRFSKVGSPLVLLTVIGRALTRLINKASASLNPKHLIQGGHSLGASLSLGLISPDEVMMGNHGEELRAKEETVNKLAGCIMLTGGVRGETTQWSLFGNKVHWYIRAMGAAITNGYAKGLPLKAVEAMEEAGAWQVFRAFSGNFGNLDFERVIQATVLRSEDFAHDRATLAEKLAMRIMYAEIARYYLAHPDPEDLIVDAQSAITVPTVNFLAEDDTIIPATNTARAMQHIPKGYPLIVGGHYSGTTVHHMLPHNHPEATAELVDAAIQTILGGHQPDSVSLSEIAFDHGLRIVG
jgi:pimeloyl-ACP methyl ester carboxylesterase